MTTQTYVQELEALDARLAPLLAASAGERGVASSANVVLGIALAADMRAWSRDFFTVLDEVIGMMERQGVCDADA